MSVAYNQPLSIENQEPLPAEEVFLTPNPTVLIHRSVLIDSHEVPYTAEFPEQLAYEGIVGFISGYGGFKRTSRGFRNAMAQAGFATATYDPARHDGDLSDPQQMHADTIMAIMDDIRSSLDVRRSMPSNSEYDLSRLTLATHSMGGLAAAQCVGQEAILNLAAAGYQPLTIPQLLRTVPAGLCGSVQNELLPFLTDGHFTPRNLIRFINYYGNRRSVAELASCFTIRVEPQIQALRAEGVKVGYIAFENDILIPPDEAVAEGVDAFTTLKGLGHLAPQVAPREVVTALKKQARQLDLVA